MKSYNVKLDFYLGVLDVSPIEFGQLNSNSCQLDFELTTDRNVVNLADKFLKLVIRTPKGQIIEDGVAVSNATGGLATIVLANDSISEVGVHICEMRMYGKTNMTLQSTKYFRYTVTPLLGEDNVEIDTRYSTVHELMWEVQRMKDDIINDAMNYESSINKPRINGVELTGNKGLQELGIQPTGDYATNGVVDTEISQHNLSGLSHPDIRNAIPKNVSQLVNDSGYLIELPVHNHDTIYYTKEQMNNSLGLKVDKELGKGLSENDFTNLYKNKLDGVEDNANNYTHPINHSAAMIVEDDLHNFVTVTEKQSWTNKAEVSAIPTKLSQLANDNNTVRDANYVHTDNNYATTEKNKLSGISTGATKTERSTTNGNVKIDGVETVVYTHPSGTNPHGTTKGDVGLGSVDNTSDASKPISAATQNALNNKVDKVVGKQLSTEDYTSAEKSKLGGVATNANNYVHPSTHPASIIVQDASNRFVSDTEKTTWNNKANTTVATTTVNGLMAKEDKTKLDSIVIGTSGNINQDITNHNANAEAHPSIIASVDKKIVLNGEVGKSNFNFISQTIEDKNQAYGLKVDLDANTFTRLGDATGKVLNDFYNFYPWADMRRQIIEGQHMVRIPKFYYKRVPIKLEEIPQSADANEIGKSLIIWEDWISPYPLSDYKVHPMFIRKGKAIDYLWFSAYEGSIYDVSANTYLLEDEQVADFTTDMLSSIPNAKPCSGLTQQLTIENARKLAENRNKDSEYEWFQQDFSTVSGIQMLITIAIGNYDCQTSIGKGAVDVADVPNTANNSLKTGQTIDMGVLCGSAGENGKSSVNFFGIENFWGNIWKFVDGFNIECKGIHQGWVSNDDYKVNTSTNKDSLGFTISKASGYMSKAGYDESIDFAFVPTETKGGKVISKDYLYQNSSYNGFLIALLGGDWDDGAYAGCFYWILNSAASNRNRFIGARLACILK